MNIVRRWWNRRAVERDMREEFEFHLEARVATLVGRGMSREDATRTARLEFGNPEAHKEECRSASGFRIWDELRSDLRFAARSLRNQPGYSAMAIAILAVAISVNTAFFALVSHHVLKPLPIRGVERHFDLRGFDGRSQGTGGWTATEIEAFRQASKGLIEGFYSERPIQMLVLEPAQRLGVISFGELLPASRGECRDGPDVRGG